MLLKILVSLACWFGIASGEQVINIDALTYVGTGCPSNTVAASISSHRTSFTLTFDEYVAIMEPGGSALDARKNCELHIGIRIPDGWSYTITHVDYRGFVYLQEDTHASKRALYYFTGHPKQSEVMETRWDGPDRRDYSISDTFPTDTVVWSACGAPDNLNIEHDIQVAGDESKTAIITTDSVDESVSHEYGLHWKKC